MHTTWALKGKTPIIVSSGSWKKLTLSGVIVADSRGKRPRLFLRSIAGNMNTEETLRFLKELKRHMRGRKLLLIWDGLPAHRAVRVASWIRRERQWLRVVRLPAYAPELNPIEYLWSAMKRKYLGNGAPDLRAIGRGLRRSKKAMNNRTLLCGFLRASELYD